MWAGSLSKLLVLAEGFPTMMALCTHVTVEVILHLARCDLSERSEQIVTFEPAHYCVHHEMGVTFDVYI
jgi:hypothetical protein